MELNKLKQKLSNEDYQYFVDKKIIYPSPYGMDYGAFCKLIFSKCIQAKKNILPLHSILSQTSYAQLIPFIIQSLVNELSSTNQSEKAMEYKIDLHGNIHSKIVFLFYCQELSQKKEFHDFNTHCSPQWFAQQFTKNFHVDLISSYFSLLKYDLIEDLPHLYDILSKKNTNGFKNNKDNANALIDIFCYYQDMRCIEQLEKMIYLLRSSDPSMAGIKMTKLLKEIEKPLYDDNLRKRVFTMFAIDEDENDFIYLNDNTFSIELDIEKLISFRKKNKIDEHIQDTTVWLLKLNDVLIQAKKEHILFCDAYQDKTSLTQKVQRHNNNTLYQRAHVELIKKFEFSYSDIQDKEIKQNIFQRYFAETIYFKYDAPIETYINLLKKLMFSVHLNNSLEDQTSCVKTNKI